VGKNCIDSGLEFTMSVDLPKVFFSYARADAEFVLKLANDLRSAGINLWIDQLDIPAGERWDSAVESALKAAPYLLVVLSPASVESQNVMDEVAFALENKKKVVPVLRTRCAIPFRLQRLQYADFTATYDNGFTQLLSALNVARPSQPPQSPAPVPHAGDAVSHAAHSQPLPSSRRLLYPLVAVALAAVLGIGYWFSAAKPVNVETRSDNDCIPPYVWRLAVSSDHVCVTEESRRQVQLENERAPQRRQADGRGAYGPDTCLSGYVWREAFEGDTVCVSAERRAQTKTENSLASQRVKR
jgi:hypothetical protein